MSTGMRNDSTIDNAGSSTTAVRLRHRTHTPSRTEETQLQSRDDRASAPRVEESQPQSAVRFDFGVPADGLTKNQRRELRRREMERLRMMGARDYR